MDCVKSVGQLHGRGFYVQFNLTRDTNTKQNYFLRFLIVRPKITLNNNDEWVNRNVQYLVF